MGDQLLEKHVLQFLDSRAVLAHGITVVGGVDMFGSVLLMLDFSRMCSLWFCQRGEVQIKNARYVSEPNYPKVLNLLSDSIYWGLLYVNHMVNSQLGHVNSCCGMLSVLCLLEWIRD